MFNVFFKKITVSNKLLVRSLIAFYKNISEVAYQKSHVSMSFSVMLRFASACMCCQLDPSFTKFSINLSPNDFSSD